MIKVLGFGLASSLFLLGACGGNSPQDECNKIASVACSKLYQCVDPATITSTLGFTSQSQCTDSYQSTLHCATAQANCPAGTTYNGAAADTCVNDYNNLACNQVASGTKPLSCGQVCQ